MFQFTLPRGERPSPSSRLRWRGVSIHAPARGATVYRPRGRQTSRSFNSRSREGSDNTWAEVQQVLQVSIHAPARGATGDGHLWHQEGDVSIHAPARGATLPPLWPPAVRQVSIHAPARGATKARSLHLHPARRFNSRSREGSDRGFSTSRTSTFCFNSRSREGSDARRSSSLARSNVSIHAPARGATGTTSQ